jgi:EF-hand domain-containing protein 1
MYHWKDLQIGMSIQTASIKVRILDADPFTRNFYDANGMSLLEPILLPKIESTEYNMEAVMTKSQADAAVLPEECIGMNSIGLASDVPRDGQKMVQYSGIILRYVAKLDNPKIEDINRVFILQIYLEDDNVQIMEPPVRNSGFKGGVFLQKTAVISSESYRSVVPTDFYIGVNIQLLSHRFIVFDADEYTMKYMEARPYLWKQTDIPIIKSKLTAKAANVRQKLLFVRNLPTKRVTVRDLLKLLLDSGLGLGFVEQEIITLFRNARHDLESNDSDTIPLSYIFNLVDSKSQ